jgi:uncharacterized membrane protein YGL010W
MATLQELLDEYSESHQNKTNKLIHYLCVPLIYFSIVALLYTIRIPIKILDIPFTAAHIALVLTIFYYARLSSIVAIAMTIFSLFCLTICNACTMIGLPLGWTAMIIFAISWVFQFIGHHVEGKKPSFLKDVQFLLIGPAWIMSKILGSFGVKL